MARHLAAGQGPAATPCRRPCRRPGRSRRPRRGVAPLPDRAQARARRRTALVRQVRSIGGVSRRQSPIMFAVDVYAIMDAHVPQDKTAAATRGENAGPFVVPPRPGFGFQLGAVLRTGRRFLPSFEDRYFAFGGAAWI